MLDIRKIREETELVRAALSKRLAPDQIDLGAIIELDDERKKLTATLESLQAERNSQSKVKPTPEKIAALKELGDKISSLGEQLAGVEAALTERLSSLPNLPADDVPAGGKENNEVIETIGTRPDFSFAPRDHVRLATELGLIDYERAVKMSGSGFWCYTGQGALLEWALLNYFINYHAAQGYKFLIPPFLLSEKSAYISGHLPKFRDDLFWTQDGTCLNATSEMMLGNYHRDELIDAELLPRKYFAYSPCFRREAGSYRQEERGMIRGHQFNKVEMYVFAKAEESWAAFDELLGHARELLRGLGLHFQISKLAAGDCSAAMAKTVDLEVYIPSMGIYKEVSSVSNSLDYQARRGQTRYRDSVTGKNVFVHTLNGSGLATSRLLPAILEQFQQADGSVIVPEVLRPLMPGNPERIQASKL